MRGFHGLSGVHPQRRYCSYKVPAGVDISGHDGFMSRWPADGGTRPTAFPLDFGFAQPDPHRLTFCPDLSRALH